MMNFLQRLMIGRYGNDTLNRVLFAFCCVLIVLNYILNWRLLRLALLLLLVVCYLRMFSRNIQARYLENQKFLTVWQPLQQKAYQAKRQFADRKTHRYYRCPQCKKRLRVPRGRGKIQITCPYCQKQFIKKT